MLELIKVSTKGQIVIPEDIRKKLKIEPGSKLIVIEKNGDIILKREEKVAQLIDAQEQKGWQKLSEQSLRDTWNNKKDEKTWKKHI